MLFILFHFLPKDELCLSEIWDAVLHLVFLPKPVLIALEILPYMSKYYTSGLGGWLASPTVFIIKTWGSQWKQCLPMHTKCSPFVPAEMWQLEFLQRLLSPPHPEALSLLSSESGESGCEGCFVQRTLLLWGMEHKWLPVTFSHKVQGSLQPCQIQMVFFIALLVIKWLTIFLIGNTNYSLHSF